jgi:hypothetical protein
VQRPLHGRRLALLPLHHSLIGSMLHQLLHSPRMLQ